MAGLARKSTEAVFAAARAAVDVSGDHSPSVRSGLFGRPIVVTNVQYRFLVAEQLAVIGAQADILLEPGTRDAETRLLWTALR